MNGTDTFMDAKMLITKTDMDKRDIAFLNTVQNQDETELRKYEDFTTFQSISPLLQGFGRVTYFEVLRKDARGYFNPLRPN